MRHSVCPNNASRLQLLEQLFTAATHDASAAMCCWINDVITLTLDEICELPLAQASIELNLEDKQLAMVVLDLEGALGGTMILNFDEPNGRRLAGSLLRSPVNAGPEWSDMEISALTETGNILCCAYINAITRQIDRQLIPSVPHFVRDYGANVLQQALAIHAAERNTVLMCRTRFRCENENLDWWVMFIPAAGLRAAMEHAMQPSC
jgi:chemotaxis protein CheC